MLTPADHARLLSYTTLATLTPDQAKDIKRLCSANTYVENKSCRWHYPVDDQGYPTPDAVRYDTPVRKASQGGCAPNPDSLSSRAPWDEEGVSRSFWYARKATREKHTLILAHLPLAMREDSRRGLKLYQACAALSRAYNLDLNDLWARVAQGVGEARGKGVLVPRLASEGLSTLSS